MTDDFKLLHRTAVHSLWKADHPTGCGSRDVQFALGVEELADDGPLIEVRRPQARFPEHELPIYKASAIGLLTLRELNVGGES